MIVLVLEERYGSEYVDLEIDHLIEPPDNYRELSQDEWLTFAKAHIDLTSTSDYRLTVRELDTGHNVRTVPFTLTARGKWATP